MSLNILVFVHVITFLCDMVVLHVDIDRYVRIKIPKFVFCLSANHTQKYFYFLENFICFKNIFQRGKQKTSLTFQKEFRY